MERLVFLGVAANGVDIRAGGEQSGDGARTAKTCGQMESGPAIGRKLESGSGRGGENRLQTGDVADGG